ncbi:MAG TPA: uroporphyrinogen decarboxylase family protein [Oscillospiraceae bacterium]|nr:uroporphyrinogen decarboxylase family protein [Oscillospiraceae bacterium]HPF55704.1 uroporphyrinogen decarboxylase family protein [Clostridiales bacterium]HPK35551.1 uroporphyrinogen decarboxylase family protein [Oscillospiraceae bacterium]HPR75913.1 uroporphyrinogen decarboxylase family protein [Oscillospiraceae bacterium]
MSLADGMAAINLEMPARVPRTEYSAHGHWDLIKAVTGLDVSSDSPDELKNRASQTFIKAWNYDFFWNILIGEDIFGDKRTKMGHAVYAAGGVDYDDKLTSLFSDPEDVFKFDPMEAYGTIDKREWIGNFNKQYAKMCGDYTDLVNMTGIYVTCMSGLIAMLGWDTLLSAAGLDPRKFGEFTTRYCVWVKQFFDALAESDAPVVMIHDDIVWTEGAFLHPDWYRKYMFPNYKKMFSPLIESGKKIMYTSDGSYTEFIDDIAGCGVHGFVLEPTTDMKYIAEKYGKTHAFIGNADTRILLLGSKEDIRNEVKRCMDIGKNCPGFFMAVGNHIPANTPVENALYYNEVYEELSRR